MRPQTLTRRGGATIAYHSSPGKTPGVVFLGGFRSDMTGEKAVGIEAFCRARRQAFVRFDYTGHGQSAGAFTEGTIGRWTEDAVAVLDELTEGPQVLVGSSMGCWIMLLAALARPGRVAALVGTAAAPDFPEDLIAASLTAAQWDALATDGVVHLESEYAEPVPITAALLEDGRRRLVLREPVPLEMPVRLIHGAADADVPWQTSLRLANALSANDVEVIVVKDGRPPAVRARRRGAAVRGAGAAVGRARRLTARLRRWILRRESRASRRDNRGSAGSLPAPS